MFVARFIHNLDIKTRLAGIENAGVRRPVVRVQTVGLARALLVEKHAAFHGGKLLGLGQLL